MERCRKAIHLRTGDRATDEAITSWLERHGVESVGCADPFEACCLALRQPELAPDLILIGVDWLAPDELGVHEYLHQTWPAAAVVLYSSGPAGAILAGGPATIVHRSAESLQRMLAGPPEALLTALRDAARPAADSAAWRPQPTLPPDTASSAGDPADAAPGAAVACGAGAPAAAVPRPAPDGEQTQAAPRTPLAQTILTREELAALLADDDG